MFLKFKVLGSVYFWYLPFDNGNKNRNIALIPSSAHGTNPASAIMAGMKVVVIACDKHRKL